MDKRLKVDSNRFTAKIFWKSTIAWCLSRVTSSSAHLFWMTYAFGPVYYVDFFFMSGCECHRNVTSWYGRQSVWYWFLFVTWAGNGMVASCMGLINLLNFHETYFDRLHLYRLHCWLILLPLLNCTCSWCSALSSIACKRMCALERCLL